MNFYTDFLKNVSVIILLLLCPSLAILAQNGGNGIWKVVGPNDRIPMFPEGPGAMVQFIYSNMKYPEIARDSSIQGIVLVYFDVKQDGNLDNVKIMHSIHPALDEEAIRIIKLMPKWTPGTKDGKLTTMGTHVMIKFDLSESRKAVFPGGDLALTKFYSLNLKTPDVAIKHGIQGCVTVGFDVEEDGTLDNFVVLKSVAPSLDEEALRVVKSMPKFVPAMSFGKQIKSKSEQTICFERNRNRTATEAIPEDSLNKMPSFPGGKIAMFKYLSDNFKYPEDARKRGIEGQPVVEFTVEKDGTLTDIHIRKSVNASLDREALRLVYSMPKWIPGLKDGKPVGKKYSVPVNFSLK
jgi:TonB family protein